MTSVVAGEPVLSPAELEHASRTWQRDESKPGAPKVKVYTIPFPDEWSTT